MENSSFEDRIKVLIVDYLREEGIGAGDAEERVRELLMGAGAKALGERWTQQASESEPEILGCKCGREMKRRPSCRKEVVTLHGRTEVWRSYYWCPECKGGVFWLDEQIGCRGRTQTGKVQECVAMVSAEQAYAGGQRLLKALAGLELAQCTLESIAKDLGRELESARSIEIQRAMQDDLESDAEEVGTLCISTDAVKVPTRDGWQDAKVVATFSYDVAEGGSEPEVADVRYSGRVENCEPAGERMYAQAVKHGLNNAKRVAVLGDGAEWIWNQAQKHFPGAMEIVDWYHATEHLWNVANTLFGQGSTEAAVWEKEREAELWEGQVDVVIERMRKLFWSLRKQDKAFQGSEQEHVLQTNMSYFSEHSRRMDYARFRQEKLPIGSGVIEAACKHYVAQRSKRSGMQWNLEGLHPILELRAALLSNQWHRVKNLCSPKHRAA